MRKVKVALPVNGYDITIGKGLAEELEKQIGEHKFSSRALLVTDSNVGKLYTEKVKESITKAGLQADVFVVPAGETSKSLETAEKIYTRAIELGLDRKSPIFALGGGVVGDLTGFVAATYMRGVPFVQIATSLLAQVDSSVGGKVAVNHRLGKNMIGAFYQPKFVLIDISCLESLPKREIYTGLGEIIKYGAIYDEDFFRYLEDNTEKIKALAESSLEHIIGRSCEIKADVVTQDEKEKGLRRILNFGHTMAHAIEKETGYLRYNHGEAVAIGMIGAANISRELGLLKDEDVQRLTALIEKLHLPTKAEGVNLEAMFESTLHDKKTVNGIVHWVLLDRIGHVSDITEAPDDVVKKCMRMVLAE